MEISPEKAYDYKKHMKAALENEKMDEFRQQLHIHLPRRLVDIVDKLAKEERRSRSNMIEVIILNHAWVKEIEEALPNE